MISLFRDGKNEFLKLKLEKSLLQIQLDEAFLLSQWPAWMKIDQRKSDVESIWIVFVLFCARSQYKMKWWGKSKALIMITNIMIAYVVFSAHFR